MADCCKFEPKIQVDCVLSILGILRNGDILAAKAELLEHAGCLIGCLGAYLKKPISPEDFFAAAPDDLPITLEECTRELESVFAVTRSDDVHGMSLSPQVVAMILKLIELLLNKFVS